MGVTFTSTATNIFANHYINKAVKARSVANVTFCLESFIGSLPPADGKRIYNARIDPHLTSGCEVSLDVNMHLLAPLQKIQHTFIRRLIGLNPRAMCAVLFSETGILPLAYRRILLALRYLLYVCALPSNHLAHCALRECQALHRENRPSWLGDLMVVLRRIPYLRMDSFSPLTITTVSVTALIDNITASLQAHIDSTLLDASKARLLFGRMERNGDGMLVHDSLRLRHYLRVTVPDHRKALAGLLLSDNILADSQLRYTERHRPAMPRHLRLCRFCLSEVEDATHALFVCVASDELLHLTSAFWVSIKGKFPALVRADSDASTAMSRLMACHPAVNEVAWFAHKVLGIYKKTNMFVMHRENHTEAIPDTTTRQRDPALDIML